jgi:hypothetical protein
MLNKNKFIFLPGLMILFALFFMTPASAEEKVSDFSATIDIAKNSVLTVSEEITYDFGGGIIDQVRREIPSVYESEGKKYKLHLYDFEVKDEQGLKPDIKIVNGRDSQIVMIANSGHATGTKTYAIKYKARGAIVFFSDKEIFPWNVGAWDVPVLQSKIVVNFPENFLQENLKTSCFSDANGQEKPCVSSRYGYVDEKTVKDITFIQDSLDLGAKIFISTELPRGAIEKPSFFWRVYWFIFDHWILASIAVLVLLVFYFGKRAR